MAFFAFHFRIGEIFQFPSFQVHFFPGLLNFPKTSRRLRMLPTVTLNCQVTMHMIVLNSGSQSQMSQVFMIFFAIEKK